MSKDPAFLFYPGDWLSGTLGMTFEEKGAYMELLMMQFNRGHMTEHMIRQVVGQRWDTLMVKFTKDDDGLWYNKRLEEEQNKRKKFVTSRLNNKLGKNQHTHMTTHMTSHMENENVIENKDLNEGGMGDYKTPQKGFIPPLISEVTAYFKEKGYSFEAAVMAYNWYNEADWFDSHGNKVFNWKQKMQKWLTPENKIYVPELRKPSRQ